MAPFGITTAHVCVSLDSALVHVDLMS